MAESDEELVQRTRRGDRQAFSRLVERYEQPALMVARSVLRSWHDATDAVQDAFVTAYEQLNRLWSANKFGAWFLKIVRRQALVHLRRRQSVARHLMAISSGATEHAENDAIESSDLAMLISRLPEQECVVVSLRHFEDLSVAEIARVTGRPIGTVTKQLSRAYTRMRVLLE